METFIFSLIVQNFDFESDAQADQLDWDKADIYASNLDGQAIFTLASVQDVQDRLSFALEAIAFLNGLDPAIEVLAVASDLVGVGDIASRTNIDRETLRTWISATRGAGNFPPPWRDSVVTERYGIGPQLIRG